MSKTSMTKDEREAFLAETRVGVFSVPEPDRGPLSVPVWYHYEPGGVVRFTTGGGSRKARAMRAGGRASLLVQTEIPPYKYASVEGPVRIVGAPDYERDVRAMAVLSRRRDGGGLSGRARERVPARRAGRARARALAHRRLREGLRMTAARPRRGRAPPESMLTPTPAQTMRGEAG